MAKIFILNGPDKGRCYDLDRDSIEIGRSPSNDIALKDRSVSRRHVRISLRDGRYTIMDLKSTNGTYVNNLPLGPGEEMEVKQGEPFAVGDIFISLDEAYTGHLQPVQESADLSEGLGDTADMPEKDRPMTAKRNMELIQKVSEVLMQPMDINELLEKILGHVFDLLKRIDRGLIILLDSETGKIVDIITSDKQSSDATVLLYSRTVVNRVIEQKKPVMLSDTTDMDIEELSDSIEMMKIKSVMCVPLVSRSKLRGVIYVDSLSRPYSFRKGDLSLLTALSSPAALAIENAFLHSRFKEIDLDKTKQF
ncbi:MAG: FHA domain-containing protein [Pseudomonadota bacterium]